MHSNRALMLRGLPKPAKVKQPAPDFRRLRKLEMQNGHEAMADILTMTITMSTSKTA